MRYHDQKIKQNTSVSLTREDVLLNEKFKDFAVQDVLKYLKVYLSLFRINRRTVRGNTAFKNFESGFLIYKWEGLNHLTGEK